MTPNQTRGYWPGNDDLPYCNTTNASIACPKGEYSGESQGIITGACPENGNPPYYCQVYSWGPLEKDHTQQPVVNIG